jgi:hypothetical protein
MGKEIRGCSSFFSTLADPTVFIDPPGFSLFSAVVSDGADD